MVGHDDCNAGRMGPGRVFELGYRGSLVPERRCDRLGGEPAARLLHGWQRSLCLRLVLEEIANAQKVRIGGLVQLTVRIKPATKRRTGRNPATRRRDHNRRQARACRSARASANVSSAVRARFASLLVRSARSAMALTSWFWVKATGFLQVRDRDEPRHSSRLGARTWRQLARSRGRLLTGCAIRGSRAR